MRRFALAWGALTRPRTWSGAPAPRRRQSGVALIVVVATMVIMTILVSEMAYGSTVRVMVAAHQRDRAQAEWLAQSGVNLYRLILTANKQLEKSSMGDMLSSMLPGVGDALWQMVPVINTGLLRMLFASGGDVSDDEVAAYASSGKVSDEVANESREASRFSGKGFLDFDGDFSAEISDEESKINVNALADRSADQALQDNPTALQLYGLMSGDENDQWFYERNLDRWDLIANLADWVDQDTMGSGTRGGYEDNLYNNLDSPYLAKNAAFDTKEEIRLVSGWEDEVFDRFEDSLTVWGSGKKNLNTITDELLAGLLRAYVEQPLNDSTVEQIVLAVRTQSYITPFTKGSELVNFVKGLGYEVNPAMATLFSSSSQTFTIKSTGLVGDSAVTLTAVVDYGSKGGTSGKVLYWRAD